MRGIVGIRPRRGNGPPEARLPIKTGPRAGTRLTLPPWPHIYQQEHFGAKRLPEIGGGLGKAIRNFKQASSEPDEIDITPKDKKTGGDDKQA